MNQRSPKCGACPSSGAQRNLQGDTVRPGPAPTGAERKCHPAPLPDCSSSLGSWSHPAPGLRPVLGSGPWLPASFVTSDPAGAAPTHTLAPAWASTLSPTHGSNHGFCTGSWLQLLGQCNLKSLGITTLTLCLLWLNTRNATIVFDNASTSYSQKESLVLQKPNNISFLITD